MVKMRKMQKIQKTHTMINQNVDYLFTVRANKLFMSIF